MRLFIAINLAAPVRRRLWEATAALRVEEPAVRWVGEEALHLTVKFLGAVDEARSGELAALLDAAIGGHRAFPVTFDGLGAFPTPARPTVLWIGCERASALELVYHDVEAACARLGFPVDGRAFHPHVTLGRVRRGQETAELGSRLAAMAVRAEDTVRSVDLMQSTLGPRGARYTLRHRAPLEAA